MKQLNSILIVFFILVAICKTNAQQVIVTDDAAYTSPASGAMLDVKSTSKGFMPPRVALTSSTDIITIASPTTGLIVYCTGTGGLEAGLYYWNGTIWTKALVGGVDGTNYLSIADNGTVRLNGSATTFDDLRVDGSRVANSGQTAPSWSAFLGGLYVNLFDDTKVQDVFFQVQLPHAWKVGTDIHPHVHWAPTGTTPGTGRVFWQLEYEWINLGDAFTNTSNTNTGYLITKDVSTPTYTLPQYEHVITSLGPITGANKTISSVLICRLTRVGSNGSDNLVGNAALLSVDFHYEIDSFGSQSEYTK